MRVLDLLSFILTVLGSYAVFLSLRLLLPYYVIQYVEARLEKMEERLNEAEAEDAIPVESEYRERFVRYERCRAFRRRFSFFSFIHRSLHNQFSQMRMASNQSPRFMQQIQLAALSCLTYKLYALCSRIGALRREVEVREIARPNRLLVATTEGPLRWRWTNINLRRLPSFGATSPHRYPLPPPVRVIYVVSFEAAHLSLSLTINVAESALCLAARETPAIDVAEPTSPPPAARGLTYPPDQMGTSQMSVGVSDQSATATAMAARVISARHS
jgi:hypothetical protein